MAKRQWDEQSFFEELRKQCTDSSYTVGQKLLAWCAERGYKVNYGKGRTAGTLAPSVYHDAQNKDCKLFELYTCLGDTPGCLLLASYLWPEVWPESPFADDVRRKQFIGQLNKLPLKELLPQDADNSRPRLALDTLSDHEKLKTFMEVHEWIAKEITNAPSFTLPEEVTPSGLIEGAVRTVTVNAYERNPEARQQCIAAHGTICCICGFSFGAVYGPEAEGYIHVHHVRPLSEIGGEYEVDPIEDLRPVCPNCHAVLHLGGRCRSIEEVRQLLGKR